MHRTLVKVVLVLVVGLALCYPLIETVDCWDNFPVTGQDLELFILGFLTLLGMIFVLQCWKLLLVALSGTLAFRHVLSHMHLLLNNPIADDRSSFPPLIPLRI